ncbi:dTDP-4-dehydrorhamnose reductase [Sphingobium indicum IP26]|uniref:dTDP-4-dehydrorhamnose reductase n=1 Tax=Sphingobium indicum F2 TaxID=1450518 RepID=A0A8E1C384_9SPHN|nr:dTDP-4-dehydrorhamnose reductase [Sphingobium indicum]EPR12690.1 dTDP-4-dehydrorhamnose reductase [Sphingobium indicum IP26]EPR14862.1 dTDP-4-dehydrorhamnose reductase [Sphingobium indicum IP26]EPR15511.1 dTDP-4-dehydrorhamnose reductase [Sphingobium indicum IP26]EPR15880.1 dTDP-4-dehydrorhamnose reductase [Sphingobium indicum IP26]KER37027.1 dTDP-4-dehydrorhamnose reductase [Sphingobium indicum F2]
MRIAVTGKTGQVVTSLIERGAAAGHEVIALGRPELDLADPASVAHALEAAAPDVIVSAAAYTAVDKAESESDLAYAVNGAGAGAVAQVARALGVPLVHVSTDYVFDGTLDRPYVESDRTGPTGAYGASKLAGEHAVLEAHGDNSAVLRVAWVYSPFGANFMKTMLRLAIDRDEVSVVADQLGNPTSALEIADAILLVATNLVADSNPALRGIFHMTASGEASWADFAEAIFAASAKKGGATAQVKRITTADYPTPATRPANSRLDCSLIAQVHGVVMPDWRQSLDRVIARLQPTAN